MELAKYGTLHDATVEAVTMLKTLNSLASSNALYHSFAEKMSKTDEPSPEDMQIALQFLIFDHQQSLKKELDNLQSHSKLVRKDELGLIRRISRISGPPFPLNGVPIVKGNIHLSKLIIRELHCANDSHSCAHDTLANFRQKYHFLNGRGLSEVRKTLSDCESCGKRKPLIHPNTQ